MGKEALGILAWAAVTLSLLVAPVHANGEAEVEAEAEVHLGQPYRDGDAVWADYAVSGLFDEEIRAALESGLPATLIFEWHLWRQRSGWWDSHVTGDQVLYRIFFDILEERYDVFDGAGRGVFTSEDLSKVEAALCAGQRIELTAASRLERRHEYYVEMKARLVPLDPEEMRDLEGWFRGTLGDEGGGNVLSSISEQVAGLLKNMVGLGSRTAWARSELFRGSG